MSEKRTIEEAKQWTELHKNELLAAMKENKDCKHLSGLPVMVNLWNAGCWLNHRLAEAGATSDEISSIGFAHGQRSFANDPYKVAVDYVNEYETNKSVQDKPGVALAEDVVQTLSTHEGGE
ncbi:hypothetical protein KS4_23670 [Poriferisphaera corsica]|uniref:Uncharacterized protein n=1 Tax=Poriferisphaera corsica TaxID=2528020 RepID=A0A517YVR0_9BACT|nr:hypothetical protein [Poriferisphaera corsica]QDU34300.1 hypothetical protein KS4_23670 [Poriferisphaera corsica]